MGGDGRGISFRLKFYGSSDAGGAANENLLTGSTGLLKNGACHEFAFSRTPFCMGARFRGGACSLVSQCQIRNVHPLGTVLASKRRSILADHDADRGRYHRSGISGASHAIHSDKVQSARFCRSGTRAGQEYMVFTTKHHDGFRMFDTSYTDYKITKTPCGKDIVKQLADACKGRGMPLGFYYSPPDRHHPAFRDTSKLAKENWNGEPARPEWPLYLDYMQLQLTELLTRYGPVALIWFDGLHHQEKYGGIRFLELIRRLQPATLVNDRIGLPGDYQTPEQFILSGIPTKGVRFNAVDTNVQDKLKNNVPEPEDFQLWETCMTINNTLAYNSHDHEYKSAQMLIRSLVEVASRGGNFQLNVGPQPDGLIQPEFQERLRAIGNWLSVNGESM